MESMQSIVWNPLQDGMESSRRKCTFGDAMRLRRYHTRSRVIPYQAYGLNKKFDKPKLVEFFGGERWIRTIEVGDNRFTVCPLWPLGNLPIWSWRLESNPQPADYKSAALPVELRQHIKFKNGASGRNRTTDTGIFSPLLYLLSYRGIFWRPGRDSNPRPLA